MEPNLTRPGFVNDVVFRHIFTARAKLHLLMDLVITILRIPFEGVSHFRLLNGDIPPRLYGGKRPVWIC